MFGFIKNFFGGIFGFLGGLLGFKKSEYFLDLGESSAIAPAMVAPVAIAPEKVEPVKSQKSEPAKKAKVEKKSKKEKEPVAIPANTAEPAKVPAATNGKVPTQAEPNRTFAPNNLMPTPTGTRRTPGPSMNNFREMARQVKNK